MTRPTIIAANWKMHKTRAEAAAFIEAFSAKAAKISSTVRLLIFPPFTAIETVAAALRKHPIANCSVGAQNVHPETHGAFTGEISVLMLRDLGVSTVLVGHSERRTLFGESDEFLLRKVQRLLAENLTPMLCVGETLAQRDSGETRAVLAHQISAIFSKISDADAMSVQIAYEPVWAIGTGRNATPDQAQQAHGWIREELAKICGPQMAANIPILYGGSVKPENAADILSQTDVDGALVGGASLDPGSFAAIASACK